MEQKTVNAVITMESGDKITLELYPDIAPITVENFVNLAKDGFYDGLIFHRVIAGFMIQGGDPMGIGIGGSGKNIKGEFAINGVKNDLSHKRGVISMARSQNYNSASSQFFICHADATFLDGQYAAFGKVTEGMETVDEIASVKTNMQDKPLYDQRMAKVEIVD
ncbi:MAG: peptidylprolyl isomerase [Clostridia bacterium]|nr:peptidylprolyl isomerase [Clostridia bacterium]